MASSDEAAKQRIITHMNNDHNDSVIRYAEHYSKLSRFSSRNALITDISLDKLVLSASGSSHTIPLDPPMTSYRDARERLVEMDQETIAGLKRSKTTVKEYRPPGNLYQIFIFSICLATYLLLFRAATVLPGSIPYEVLFKHIPAFAAFVLRVRLWVLIPMIAIHLGEVYIMTGRLENHSVPLFSRLWWAWVGSCFIEGFGSFQRLDDIVEEKEKKQVKH